ncbi:MAG: L-rhamnose mutarotase [Alicyclobacillaceae bacterium]|nr:L-rhamnose mutarotase [Alicyclobacillaceae bacterium]
MKRIGFKLRIRPGTEAEYKERHKAVYPELLSAFEDYGIQSYSIFMDGTTLFGYIEADDPEAALRALDENLANRRWQQYMSDILLADERGVTLCPLEEVFYFHPTQRA